MGAAGDRRASAHTAAAASMRMAGKGRKVFVNNLHYRVEWQELKDVMRSAGDVKFVEICKGKNKGGKDGKGRSLGCAYVEFMSDDDVDRAIQDLNGTTFEGRRISV